MGRSSVLRLSVCPSVRPSICPFVCPSVRLSIGQRSNGRDVQSDVRQVLPVHAIRQTQQLLLYVRRGGDVVQPSSCSVLRGHAAQDQGATLSFFSCFFFIFRSYPFYIGRRTRTRKGEEPRDVDVYPVHDARELDDVDGQLVVDASLLLSLLLLSVDVSAVRERVTVLELDPHVPVPAEDVRVHAVEKVLNGAPVTVSVAPHSQKMLPLSTPLLPSSWPCRPTEGGKTKKDGVGGGGGGGDGDEEKEEAEEEEAMPIPTDPTTIRRFPVRALASEHRLPRALLYMARKKHWFMGMRPSGAVSRWRMSAVHM